MTTRVPAEKWTDGRYVAHGLERVFISPNECDSNFENANVVDGLFAIARAVESLANAIKQLKVEASGGAKT